MTKPRVFSNPAWGSPFGWITGQFALTLDMLLLWAVASGHERVPRNSLRICVAPARVFPGRTRHAVQSPAKVLPCR